MNVKTIIAVPVVVAISIMAAVLLTLSLQAPSASAQAKSDNKKSDTKTTKDVTYKYVAQPGDSYSEMARKAVQTYGKKHKVNLSNSRIIYAETHLTQEAGSPLLNLGQEVTISENTVKSWVEKARKLSNDAAAKWDAYTQSVNFNTDNVGESR